MSASLIKTKAYENNHANPVRLWPMQISDEQRTMVENKANRRPLARSVKHQTRNPKRAYENASQGRIHNGSDAAAGNVFLRVAGECRHADWQENRISCEYSLPVRHGCNVCLGGPSSPAAAPATQRKSHRPGLGRLGTRSIVSGPSVPGSGTYPCRKKRQTL